MERGALGDAARRADGRAGGVRAVSALVVHLVAASDEVPTRADAFRGAEILVRDANARVQHEDVYASSAQTLGRFRNVPSRRDGRARVGACARRSRFHCDAVSEFCACAHVEDDRARVVVVAAEVYANTPGLLLDDLNLRPACERRRNALQGRPDRRASRFEIRARSREAAA